MNRLPIFIPVDHSFEIVGEEENKSLWNFDESLVRVSLRSEPL